MWGEAERFVVFFDEVLGKIGEVFGSFACILLLVVVVRLFVRLDCDALTGETISPLGILRRKALSSRPGSDLEIGT